MKKSQLKKIIKEEILKEDNLEKSIIELGKNLQDVDKLINKAIKEKDKKKLDIYIKYLNKISKNLSKLSI